MLSSAMMAAIEMQTMDDSFLDRKRAAGKEHDTSMARKEGQGRVKEKQEILPEHCELEHGLLYFNNRLFIPSKKELLTEIAKGCHDSTIAGHSGREKTFGLVRRDFNRE